MNNSSLHSPVNLPAHSGSADKGFGRLGRFLGWRTLSFIHALLLSAALLTTVAVRADTDSTANDIDRLIERLGGEVWPMGAGGGTGYFARGEASVDQFLAAYPRHPWGYAKYSRSAAAIALSARLHAPTSALLERSSDPDWRVRYDTVRVLGELGGPRALEALLAHLDDPEDEVRWTAARALIGLSGIAVEPLIERLAHPDAAVRAAAALALGRIGDVRAASALLEQLDDPDLPAAETAALALGAMADRRAVEPLIGRMGKDGDYIIAKVLGWLGDPRAVDVLIARLGGERDWTLAESIVEALAALGDPRALEPLIAELERATTDSGGARDTVDPDATLVALARLGDPRALEPMLLVLEQGVIQSWSLRWGLTQFGDTVIEPMTERLTHDDPFVRDTAAEVLESVRRVQARRIADAPNEPPEDPRTLDDLLADLEGASGADRFYIFRALGRLDDPQAFAPLMAHLNDWDDSIRFIAVRSLGRLGALDRAELAPLIPRYARTRFYPMLAVAPHYADPAPALVHHATTGPVAYPRRLAVLQAILDWRGERARVSADRLDSALAALLDPRNVLGHDPERVLSNPFLAAFLARLHLENDRPHAALHWSARGLRHASADQTALRVVLSWFKAEALLDTGRIESAEAIVDSLEHDLLPRLSRLERYTTDLPFDDYTASLRDRANQHGARDG